MRWLSCCLLPVFAFVLLAHVTSANENPADMYVSVHRYFPNLHRDLSKVTWAHAVNSHKDLKAALADNDIMMIEADVSMGLHGISEEMIPIMAHPPSRSSDLTFAEFIEAVIEANSSHKKKGVKLDFKEIEAVEPCLKILNDKMQAEYAKFPVFVNADILPGPVNSTTVPLDPAKFIPLVKLYAPYAVLSVGWTTRYGEDDGLSKEEIREGKYTRDQMKMMMKILREYAFEDDRPVFKHITFPVRAGLAADSVEEILYLTGRVRGETSITLWSAPSDPVSRRKLKSLIQQQNSRSTFIDLPFSVDEEDSAEEFSSEEHLSDQDPSLVQHLEGRGEGEHGAHSGASSSRLFSRNALIPIGVLGLVTSFFILYHNRH